MENTQPPARKNNDFFSWFGKIVFVLLVLALLIYGGYYFGMQSSKKAAMLSPTPSPSTEKQSTTQAAPTATTQPTQTTAATKTVSAGLASGTVFKQYSIQIPAGWTDTHDSSDVSDKLTIKNGAYALTIYQAAFGGGGCVYKGDPPAQMAQTFTDYADITGKAGQFRRSWNQSGNPAGTINYTVCQKSTSDGSYGDLTTFGRIDAVAPAVPDKTILSEIDSMIASMTKQ